MPTYLWRLPKQVLHLRIFYAQYLNEGPVVSQNSKRLPHISESCRILPLLSDLRLWRPGPDDGACRQLE